VAAYPLNVEELAEVLAIDFSGTGMMPMMDENLRWEDKERAVLSACSSLVTIVQDGNSRLVQFSHFSVKEFLTSERLGASKVDTLPFYHIRHEAAHLVMAQVCLSVLLKLEDHMDKEIIRNYPLSNYAGKHFGNHVEFENVISRISDGVDKLLDRDKPHFYIWVWLRIGDWDPNNWHNLKISRGSKDLNNPEMDIIQYDDTKPKCPPRLPPLYYVAALGHVSLAHHLISKCPQDLGVRDNKGCTPLHIAVLARQEGVSQLLIEHSVDLDIRNIDHQTPLHIMAYMGLSNTTQILLDRGEPLRAGLNARDKNNWTPLHLATQKLHSDIVASLLKFGADADAQDSDTITSLLLVSQTPLPYWRDVSRITEIAQLLLEHGASVHVRNEHGQTPLHVASHHGLSGIVALLLKFGADVDAKDNNTMTPLLLVSKLPLPVVGDHSQATKIAQLLLEYDASVHVRNKTGQMPLHTASYHGLSGIVALLLKFGADVNAHDNDTMTPLLLVSQSQLNSSRDDSHITEIAQLLLEHGASIHVRTKNGQMLLHLASQHSFSGIVALLLKLGTDVDAQDNDAMTPLLLVSQTQLTPIVGDESRIAKTAQVLLEHGASVHMRNKNGQMPLHTASCHGLSGVVALLLKFGADVNAQCNDALTPLLLLSQTQPLLPIVDDSQITKTAQLLLEHGASLHVQNKNGHMPLHAASYLGLCGIVTLLMKFGADVDAQDSDTLTPLHLVSLARPSFLYHSQIVKTAQLLLEHGASVHACDKHGHMPLHYASHGLSGIVALLLKFGADVDATDGHTMTPLQLALLLPPHVVGYDSEITKIAQLLLEHGASVHVRDESGQVPLHIASHLGLSDIVTLLPKFGADVDAQDNDTMTPLHLISRSPPPVFGDDSQITKIARLLLKKGASVHARNKHGHVPLHLASHHGLSGVVEVLLKFGADVNARDKINSTPMHFAISSPFTRGFPESHPGSPQMNWSIIRTTKLLLAHGANLQIQNVIGETPFHVALRRRELFIFNLLTQHVQNDQAM
jgi:ankyrin repeat protein